MAWSYSCENIGSVFIQLSQVIHQFFNVKKSRGWSPGNLGTSPAHSGLVSSSPSLHSAVPLHRASSWRICPLLKHRKQSGLPQFGLIVSSTPDNERCSLMVK